MSKLTGIGSTPFTNFDRAIDFSKTHDLVFFPEPKEYFLKPEVESIKYFLKKTKNIGEIKFQFIGPTTFIKQNQKTINEYENALNSLIEILKKEKKKIYLQIDEPILPASELEKNQLKLYLNVIHKESIIPLLHSCAKISDVLFFDFLEYGQLAIDLNLNPQFSTCEKLLISGINLEDEVKLVSEFFSYTCGLGMLTEEECMTFMKKTKNLRST